MPSKRKKKPAAPKPRWERPGQTTAEFLAEVERRTKRPFGMSQDGVDYLDNLMEYSIKVERDANEAIPIRHPPAKGGCRTGVNQS